MFKKAWSVAAVGGVCAAGAVLSGCGGGSGGHGVALNGSSGGQAPVTTVPVTTGSATTAPAPATTAPVPAKNIPATTVPIATAPPTTAAAGSSSPAPVLIVRSFDGTVGYEGREPSSIGFSGDSSNIVTHLTWSSWGPTSAVGHGMLGVDDCNPNCAAGTVTQEPATVDLGQVVNGHFTAITEKSASLDRSYTYPSNWAASAS